MPNTNEFEDSSQQSRDKLLDPSPLKENRLVKAGLFIKRTHIHHSLIHIVMDTRKEREQVWTATTTALKMKKSSRNGLNKDNLDVFGFEKGKLPKGSAYIKYQSYICNKSRSYIQKA